MQNKEIGELTTQIVVAALQSSQTGLISAEEIAKYYEEISKRIYKTDKELAEQERQTNQSKPEMI